MHVCAHTHLRVHGHVTVCLSIRLNVPACVNVRHLHVSCYFELYIIINISIFGEFPLPLASLIYIYKCWQTPM